MLTRLLYNGTAISNVKSCTYKQCVNAASDLRPGCVSSACIDVEVYGSAASAPPAGAELTYYQVDTDGNATLIGIFYAEPAITTRNTYKITAYDAVAKLDCDYSETLESLTFPTTVYSIVASACSVAGVTLASNSWALSTQAVQEFYSEGVTCRNILEWAAEIACCFVRCNTSGELVFDWYDDSSYSIGPTNGTNIIPYKQDGLTYENYYVKHISSVAVRPVESEGVACIYPEDVDQVYATDPDSDGNIVLYNISATDSGTAGIVTTGDFYGYDDGVGNVDLEALYGQDNSLIIGNNLLLTSATTAILTAVATNIYTVMSALPTWRPAQAKLFSFNCPFMAGEIVPVTDIQDVSFTTIITSITISESGATVSGSANESQDSMSYSGNVSKNLQRLNAQYIQLYGDVVFVSNLTDGTTTISGDNILTGTITSIAINNGSGTFSVDANGNLVATSATITGAITATSLTLGSGVTVAASSVSGLASVATSGAASDVSGLATVATSGSYNDLSDQPTIPSLTGYIYVDGTIGSTPASGATGFVVSSAGLLTASNAIIYGTIYSSAGTIGGFTINSGNLKSGTAGSSGFVYLGSANYGSSLTVANVSLSTWRLVLGTAFGVTNAGVVYASNAYFSSNVRVGGSLSVYTSSAFSTLSGYVGSLEYYDDNLSSFYAISMQGDYSAVITGDEMAFIGIHNSDTDAWYDPGSYVDNYPNYLHFYKDSNYNTYVDLAAPYIQITGGTSVTINSNPALSAKLLWSNTSTSSFAAQTITTTGLSGYDLVAIVYTMGVGLNTVQNTAIGYYTSGRTIRMTFVDGDSGSVYGYFRTATFYANSITFVAAWDESENTANNYIIPRYVYGIKLN